MNMTLALRPLEDKDIPLLNEWLHKPYILKWYEDPKAWMDEMEQRNGAFSFIRHFMVTDEATPVGFCQYYDCCDAGEDWYSAAVPGEMFSIDYLIGEERYLGRGCGKQIIRLLLEEVRGHTHAKEVVVQPEEENGASCDILLANGFVFDEAKGYFRLSLS
ncbi:MAG: acetyltransferase [Oscillospiraceae bacterium]|jgi:RimJ/RimL family protein N-acetyltransferase|nr:acetyltransferase [Oscillospiraceae bacterium]